MKIVALSGSLREASGNTALLRAMQKLAPEGMDITIYPINTFPLFNEDVESSTFPAEVQAVKEAVAAADGVIIATPEYNRSMSGALKNAIDWISRPYGKNSFAGKPALVAGVSGGRIGTAVAQSHLRQVLLHLNMTVIGQPELYLGPGSELFDESGAFADAGTEALVQQGLEQLRARIAQ